MNSPSQPLIVLEAVLLSVSVCGFLLWSRFLYLHRSHPAGLMPALLPPRTRRRPFWSPADALVMFGLMQVFLATFVSTMMWQRSVPVSAESGTKTALDPMVLMAASLVASIIATVLTVLWLRVSDRAAWANLGLDFSIPDAILGLKAAVMILPPVLLVSGLAGYFITYEHPVLNLMANIDSPAKFALLFATTAIVTPIAEEFLFRVLLMGGLERIWEQPREDSNWHAQTMLPLIVSSLIFALMHLGQGAAPIPLFVLALGLGYLYRQTGNITAPVIVHMVLNATTLIVELAK